MPRQKQYSMHDIISLWHTLAAPVLLGMMLKLAALPPLQSLAEGPSTVFWVAERHHIFSPLHVKNHPMIKELQEIQRELTSDGMDSGHQTLNNTEVVMNDLIVDIRKH
jgi:hypothetical protein